MRVCMISYSFYDTDCRILQYTKALQMRGDSVDVVALRKDSQPRFSVVDGVNVHRIQARVRDETNKFVYLWRILRFLLYAMLTVTRLHGKQRFDIIHVHSVPDFLVFAAFVPRLLGTPVILDIHDILPEFFASKFSYDESSLLFRILLIEERISTRFASHVIVANHIWHKRIEQRCRCEGRSTPICNYPDAALFRMKPDERRGEEVKMIYPGTLNRHQGVDIAVRAFARIAGLVPRAHFHIYGEGPEKASLAALAQSLGVAEQVSVHDFVPLDQITPIMAAADLAVVPKRVSSRFGNEAASTKIPQFMALGVPVVVSRTAIDSFYYDDSLVRFVEPENEPDLAAAMLSLLNDPESRRRLAHNSLEYVREHSWPRHQHTYLELVDGLTVRPKGGRGRSAKSFVRAGA